MVVGTTLAGAMVGSTILMLGIFPMLLDPGPDPKMPPLVEIGAAAGFVGGLIALGTPECPRLPRGPRDVDSASVGPTVRIVLAESPLINDADARIVRTVGQTDVIIFWASAATPRSIYMALWRLDAIRNRTGDSVFRSISVPLRDLTVGSPREHRMEETPEGRRMLDAERSQARRVYEELASRATKGPKHSVPGIGEGVYVDVTPIRHRRIVVAAPRQ